MQRETRNLLLLSFLVLGGMGCRDSIRELASREPQQRGKAGETLLNQCKHGELDPSEAKQIAEILLPRFEQTAKTIRISGNSSATYFAAEPQLAYEIVRQGLISESDSIALVSHLDVPWCQFIPRSPSRFELHGKLMLAPAGIVVHRLVSAVDIDGQTIRQKVLETFICPSGSGSITWGDEDLVELQPNPIRTLSIEMKTTWYNLPPESLKSFPNLARSKEALAEFQAIVRAESAKRLCAYSETATLTEADEWKSYFLTN